MRTRGNGKKREIKKRVVEKRNIKKYIYIL